MRCRFSAIMGCALILPPQDIGVGPEALVAHGPTSASVDVNQFGLPGIVEQSAMTSFRADGDGASRRPAAAHSRMPSKLRGPTPRRW